MVTLVGLPSGHMQINIADSALTFAEIKAAQAPIAMPSMRRVHFIGHPSAFLDGLAYAFGHGRA
jgi:hypothetical protein